MPLSWFACANCGFWQRHFAPPDCPVCSPGAGAIVLSDEVQACAA